MFWTEVLGRFLPRLCLLCESPCGCEPLCRPCRAFLPGAGRLRCLTCARPWQVSDCCASCRAAPPAYEATLAAADYVAPLDRALTALKFSGQVGLATALGSLLASAWSRPGQQPAAQPAAQPADAPRTARSATDSLDGSAARISALHSPGRIDFLVPIPLSSARLAERGFNQAHLIAASMLKQLHRLPPSPAPPLPASPADPADPAGPADPAQPADRALPLLRAALLVRHRDTRAQSLLNWDDRQANLDHGFAACGRLDGLRIGVVDDVMTTGATLQAAALALKAAGAASVVNLVVARTA